MSRAPATLIAIGLLLATAARGDDSSSPHLMTKSDGSLNMETCGVCHNEDMSLQRSKLETCTLCHAQSAHAGSDAHVRASAAAVKQIMGEQKQEGPALPLTEEGKIYCGTCHLFHDPKVLGEDWLAHGWLPPDSGVPGAVRQQDVERWAALAQKTDEKSALGSFATEGTRQLRMPVNDGQLCRQCHGSLQ